MKSIRHLVLTELGLVAYPELNVFLPRFIPEQGALFPRYFLQKFIQIVAAKYGLLIFVKSPVGRILI
jgi:hypothetical protein